MKPGTQQLLDTFEAAVSVMAVFARALIVALACWPAVSVSAQTGLAGTWRLDKARSELSGGLRTNQSTLEQSLTIETVENVVTVKTTTVGEPLGTRVTTEQYEIDGVSRTFTPGDRVGSRNAKGTRTAKWFPRQRGFETVEEVTRDLPGGTFTVQNTGRWSLSDDGMTLTVESTTRGPQGNIHTRRVLTKGQ